MSGSEPTLVMQPAQFSLSIYTYIYTNGAVTLTVMYVILNIRHTYLDVSHMLFIQHDWTGPSHLPWYVPTCRGLCYICHHYELAVAMALRFLDWLLQRKLPSKDRSSCGDAVPWSDSVLENARSWRETKDVYTWNVVSSNFISKVG